MYSKNDVKHPGMRLLICLLLCMLMIPSVSAEAVSESLSSEPAEQTTAASVSVQTDGSQLHTGPVLMVTDYSIVAGETLPSSSFVLEMNIANLSEHASAHNVLATLTIENVSVSLQQGATNQKYFHEILPTETVTIQFPLEVYSYCVEENMILSMTMTCYDEAAVHYNFQTMMTPSVDVARTLQIGSLSVPQFVHRNSSMIISATLNNSEPVTLNHVKMHVLTQYGEQVTELAQILSGESKTINCIFRFPEQQTENVQVYFSYESLYGHKYTTDPRSFEVIVYDPSTEDTFAASDTLITNEILQRLIQSTVIPGSSASIPIPVFVLILTGFAGYGVILYRVLRKKRR